LTIDEKYIERCFRLAENGLGEVAPNPLVGCVIVYNNKIIGEGYHSKYGKAHAEVNAINNVKNKEWLCNSTLYVNLEPCAHYGKTPPCVNLILEHKIPRVVIANTDPNPLVSGKGIQQLKEKGIEVVKDILAPQGLFLNRRFFTWIKKKRPYVILKWAQSIDGYLASDSQKKITGSFFDVQNHLWRTQESAIMVGTNTIRHDNPQLTARLVHGKQPIRVVVDRNLELEKYFNVFNGKSKTVILNLKETKHEGNLLYKQVIHPLVEDYLQALYELNIQSVIVEGGAKLLNSFIAADLFDEARVAVGNVYLGGGVKAPQLILKPSQILSYDNDKCLIFYNTTFLDYD
jgi:diaminohydroxyphosphoribosylaminopyrimidine deaminase/5-amino-6-(5-phosphoribosylamino)uracil reductase